MVSSGGGSSVPEYRVQDQRFDQPVHVMLIPGKIYVIDTTEQAARQLLGPG